MPLLNSFNSTVTGKVFALCFPFRSRKFTPLGVRKIHLSPKRRKASFAIVAKPITFADGTSHNLDFIQ